MISYKNVFPHIFLIVWCWHYKMQNYNLLWSSSWTQWLLLYFHLHHDNIFPLSPTMAHGVSASVSKRQSSLTLPVHQVMFPSFIGVRFAHLLLILYMCYFLFHTLCCVCLFYLSSLHPGNIVHLHVLPLNSGLNLSWLL